MPLLEEIIIIISSSSSISIIIIYALTRLSNLKLECTRFNLYPLPPFKWKQFPKCYNKKLQKDG